jgi:glycosyltransferase involved in cell wall biosynthesis
LRGDALARAYAQMDIFAFPSELHTEGSVLLEAMASGLPVITIGGSGVEGFIQGVRSLVRNRERREAMGSAARARATELLSSDGIFTDACHAYDLAISDAHAGDRVGVALSPA